MKCKSRISREGNVLCDCLLLLIFISTSIRCSFMLNVLTWMFMNCDILRIGFIIVWCYICTLIFYIFTIKIWNWFLVYFVQNFTHRVKKKRVSYCRWLLMSCCYYNIRRRNSVSGFRNYARYYLCEIRASANKILTVINEMQKTNVTFSS